MKSVFDKEKTFKLFGENYDTKDGTCVRDYINVEDLAQAHLLALEYLNNGGETTFFNLGTNEGNTVKEVFNECEKVPGKKVPLEICPPIAGDPAVLIADNSKILKELGWKPQNDLDKSIETAYKWESVRIAVEASVR